MIKKIKIENYKNFQSFEYDGFKRVNLIAGKNNVGKTNLLEAIYLAESSLDPLTFIFFHSGRNAIPLSTDGKTIDPNEVDSVFEDAIESYFYNQNIQNPIKLEINGRKQVARFSNYTENHAIQETGNGSVTLSPTDGFDPKIGKIAFGAGEPDKPHYLKFYGYPFNPIAVSLQVRKLMRFIMPTDFEPINYEELYNQILLNKNQALFRKLSRIVFGNEIGDLRQFADLKSKKKHYRVSDSQGNYRRIGEYGFGTNRMLKMFLFLLNSKDSALFIDEVDSGIHYSKQSEFWELVFEISSAVNVQIFATTHSRDCFEAFAKVAINHPGEGQFVRLENRGDEVEAVEYSEQSAYRATQIDTEVR